MAAEAVQLPPEDRWLDYCRRGLRWRRDRSARSRLEGAFDVQPTIA